MRLYAARTWRGSRPGATNTASPRKVCVIAQGLRTSQLRAALEIDEAEQKILEMLARGITMREARKQLGYHQLQTKRP